jgi:hypothetical protein
MSEQAKSERPVAAEQSEYTKPEVEVLGDLRELTEGVVQVQQIDNLGVGSQL